MRYDLAVAVLTAISAGSVVGQENERWRHTEKIKSLTVAQAESLAEIYSHPGHSSLCLDGLTNLSDEVAEALAHGRGSLSLNGLTTLAPTTAEKLSRSRRDLYLNGLGLLSDRAAAALTGSEKEQEPPLEDRLLPGEEAEQDWKSLHIDGLEWISEGAAKALAQHKGYKLSLNGLTELSDEAAKALAQHKGYELSLNGLTELSDEAAKALAHHKGYELSLNGLTELSDEAAESLASKEGRLSLRGLKRLSAKAAKKLRSASTPIFGGSPGGDGPKRLEVDLPARFARER